MTENDADGALRDAATLVSIAERVSAPVSRNVPAGSEAPDLWSELRPGARFGQRSRFELVQSIGSGGIGLVFLVKDWELDRLVAGKFIQPNLGLDWGQTLSYLRLEAQATAKLNHENIVSVFDIGVWQQIPYFLMEFLQGTPLDDLLKTERPSPIRATEIMLQIARGLGHAHSQGVMHLDLKPSNIFILKNGRVKILDFGLAGFHRTQTAMLALRGVHEESQTSLSFQLIGTPPYMAPEQWLGANLDQRTDIWSVGIIFFEMLAGRRPFEGNDLPTLRADITSRKPTPSLREHVETIEIAEFVVSRALQKDPALRLQSANELIEGLNLIHKTYVASSRPLRVGRASARRQLTVFVCSLSAGAPFYAEPEDVDERGQAALRFHDDCANVVEKLDGVLVGSVGQDFIAAFGYPIAHEDDAQRAVRAGLRIAEMARKEGLSVGLGIDSGLVVVEEQGEGHLALHGAPPIVARALSSRAAPDRVVVSQSTLRLACGFFATEAMGEQTLDGVARAVECFKVAGESDLSSRFEHALSRGTVPLVGRGRQLAWLEERWAEAKAGRGSFAMLTAEAGMGKSRLAAALKERVGEEPESVRMTCQCWSHFSNSAFQPVIELVRRSMDLTREDPPDVRATKIQTSLSGYDLVTLFPVFASLLSVDISDGGKFAAQSLADRKLQTIDGLISMLMTMASRRPTLLLFEDLHWVDPSTLEFLDVLMSRVSASRLLVLLTARPEFSPPWAALPQLHRLELERLSVDAATALIARICGDSALPAELLEQVVAKTDGVPLFIEETTRMLIEAGFPGDEQGLRPAVTVGIPATLHELLNARLDRLPAVGKEVAQIAGAIGRSFSYRLIRQICEMDPDELSYGLSRLVGAGVLVSQGPVPDTKYQFRHTLILDAAYHSLLKSRRQKLHRRIADVLSTSVDQVEPELLGHHYAEAGDTDKSLVQWEKAGRAAVARSANVEAIHHFSRALGLLRALPESDERNQREMGLQLLLGSPLMAVKGYAAPEVEKTYARARELSGGKGDPLQLFAATHGLWQYYMVRGDLPVSRKLGEQLLSLADGQAKSSTSLVLAHRALATSMFLQGDLSGCVEHTQRGCAHYEFDEHRAVALRTGHDPGVAHRCYLSWSLWILGRPDAAFARVLEALELAERIAHPHTLAYAMGFETLIRNYRGDFVQARDRAAIATAISRDHKFALWLAWNTMQLGWAQCGVGEVDEGIANFKEGLAGWMRTGARAGLTFFPITLADLCVRAARFGEAIVLLDEAWAAIDQNDEHFYEAELCRVQAELHLAQKPDDAAGAEAWLERGLAIAQKQSARSWELRLAHSLHRLLASQPRRGAARAELERVYASFDEGHATKDLTDARNALAT